jgi:hypothetical protein
MKDLEIQNKRNSFMEMDEIYFWTATIHNWRKLLLKDDYKEIIIDSLKYLVSNNLCFCNYAKSRTFHLENDRNEW